MSSKFIIHKFENGNNTKTISLLIGSNEADDCKFSKWVEGKIDFKKKNTNNSRLVVKKVSEDDINHFKIDACAKEINGLNERKINISLICQNTVETSKNRITDNEYRHSSRDPRDLNLLEYSLEKVKENNARIMDNINKLNRTLTYTKKREIFDIICPRQMRSFPCDVCGKCFVYETGLRRHYSLVHAAIEKQQKWQIVWTCTECFQVWPHQELAIKHSDYCCKVRNTDCIREIKTSLLLQCEFCEKVYTSIPRLLKHSRTHATNKNYECNVCKLSFDSYKYAEQHWIECPWHLMCYKFSLPKMLLCNACDRKFRNYDQLYNHRYKMNHFILKMSCDVANTAPVMEYQCENCAQSFTGMPHLLAHHNQNHPSLSQLMLYINSSEDNEVN